MRQKNIKSRCTKRSFSKCDEVCRTYDQIQEIYAQRLQNDPNIKAFQCNVFLEGLEIGEFTSDFVAFKEDGDLCVRECVWRKNITRPRTLKLLDSSRSYWAKRGVTDWGIVIDEKKE